MKWHIQFSRYAIVGLASNAVGFLLYLIITSGGMGHKSAMTLLYLVGIIQTFHFNRGWSFRYRGKISLSFIRYVTAYGIGYLLNLGMLAFGVDFLGFPHQFVQALAIIIVAIALFILHRFWVFTPEDHRGIA